MFMLRIKHIKPKQENIHIVLKIQKVGDLITWKTEKAEGTLKIVDAIDADDSLIKLKLWNTHNEGITENDNIELLNAYADIDPNENYMYLTIGKYGKLRVL